MFFFTGLQWGGGSFLSQVKNMRTWEEQTLPCALVRYLKKVIFKVSTCKVAFHDGFPQFPYCDWWSVECHCMVFCALLACFDFAVYRVSFLYRWRRLNDIGFILNGNTEKYLRGIINYKLRIKYLYSFITLIITTAATSRPGQPLSMYQWNNPRAQPRSNFPQSK